MGVGKGFLVIVPVLHLSVGKNIIGHMYALMGKDDKVLYIPLILRHKDPIPLALLIDSYLEGHAGAVLIPHLRGVELKALFQVSCKLLRVPYEEVHTGSPEIIVVAYCAKTFGLLGHKNLQFL